MTDKLRYGDVESYLATYSTAEPPYDFNGLLHLVLAGLENLRLHAVDQDLLDYAGTMTDGQAQFLHRLLESRGGSTAQ